MGNTITVSIKPLNNNALPEVVGTEEIQVLINQDLPSISFVVVTESGKIDVEELSNQITRKIKESVASLEAPTENLEIKKISEIIATSVQEHFKKNGLEASQFKIALKKRNRPKINIQQETDDIQVHVDLPGIKEAFSPILIDIENETEWIEEFLEKIQH